MAVKEGQVLVPKFWQVLPFGGHRQAPAPLRVVGLVLGSGARQGCGRECLAMTSPVLEEEGIGRGGQGRIFCKMDLWWGREGGSRGSTAGEGREAMDRREEEGSSREACRSEGSFAEYLATGAFGVCRHEPHIIREQKRGERSGRKWGWGRGGHLGEGGTQGIDRLFGGDSSRGDDDFGHPGGSFQDMEGEEVLGAHPGLEQLLLPHQHDGLGMRRRLGGGRAASAVVFALLCLFLSGVSAGWVNGTRNADGEPEPSTPVSPLTPSPSPQPPLAREGCP